MSQNKYFPTVWLSDIHLGSIDCKADYLLKFLNDCDIDTLYLVGDIVDIWAMKSSIHWPKSHQQVLDKIISLSEHGTRVVYIPGNHDDPIRKYLGLRFANIDIQGHAIHQSQKGKRYLVIHGDQFDADVLIHGKWFAWVGDKAYDLLLLINRINNSIRGHFGYSYWSLAGYIKNRVDGAKNAIQRYKRAACSEAKKQHLDGIICGHIHHPEYDVLDGIEYFNDGDWIENCTALVEDEYGEMRIIYATQTTISSATNINDDLVPKFTDRAA